MRAGSGFALGFRCQVCLTLALYGNVDSKVGAAARSRCTRAGHAAACRRDRQRLRWLGRRAAARRAGVPGDGAGASGRAGRTRARASAGRLHLRRGPDHRHRALLVRGALGAPRAAIGRRRRVGALVALLPTALRGRLHLRLFGRPCGDARRSGAAQPRRRGRLRALHALERRGLPDRLRTARPRPVRLFKCDGARGACFGAPRRFAERPRPRRAPCPGRTAAGGALLPSAADRRESFLGERPLRPDRASGAALGRVVGHRRHRQPRARPRRADRGRGRRGPARRRGAAHHRAAPTGDGRGARFRRNGGGRRGRVQRGLRLDLRRVAAARAPA